MKRIALAAVTVLLFGGCTGDRPLLRTEQTQNKTDAEMRADLAECQKQQGEYFLFGPAVAVIPLRMMIGGTQDVGFRHCLEAKGYKLGPLPPQKSAPAQGVPGQEPIRYPGAAIAQGREGGPEQAKAEQAEAVTFTGFSTPPTAVAPPRARLSPAEEIYKNALTNYAKGNYDLAVIGFRACIQGYPETCQVAEAQYWLGESYYSQKNYAQAVEEFDVVIRDYPGSPRVPSALFKQGDAYVQINDTKRATTVLCELIGKYPKTREARLARERNVRCRP